MIPFRVLCTRCGAGAEASDIGPPCGCGAALISRFLLKPGMKWIDPDAPNLWRYRPLLPLPGDGPPVALGEGGTPLIEAPRLARRWKVGAVWIKDESINPTCTFKARGMAVAVTRAKQLGVRRLCVASAGNAGAALAAYAARAGLKATVFLPKGTPESNVREVRGCGADVVRVGGTLSDANRSMRRAVRRLRAAEMSTFREPGRVDGKKTIGLELAEAFGFRPPDWIVCPAGGGVALVGIAKGFSELAELGVMKGPPSRMVAAQARGCSPLAAAFESGASEPVPWTRRVNTVAAGLRVPAPLAGALILRIVRDTQGVVATAADAQIRDAAREVAEATGILCCPEGAAGAATVRPLRRKGVIGAQDRVVVLNTGAASKYERWP